MVELAFTRLGGVPAAPDLLVVGPSLGTSVGTLWGPCAGLLGDRFEVVGWDLPGHGRSAPAGTPFSVDELAEAVRDQADRLTGTRVARGAWYAGVSLGGAVGLRLGLDPGPFRGVAALASAGRIGDPPSWAERAAIVRRDGMASMVEGSALRWFAPGFAGRDPVTAGALLAELTTIDSESYALACDALAAYDLRTHLPDTKVPLLVVAGRHDRVLAPDVLRATAENVPEATFEILEQCGHLPPAEDPAAVAAVLLSHLDLFGAER